MTSAHSSSAALGIPPANGVLSTTSEKKPPKDPSYPPPFGVCRWYDMPYELKEMVLEWAYGPYGTFKPLARAGWERAEKNRRQEQEQNFRPRPFPNSLVSQFMVHREWLLLALQLFFKRTTFRLDYAYEASEFTAAASFYTVKTSQRQSLRRRAEMSQSMGLDRRQVYDFIASISQCWVG